MDEREMQGALDDLETMRDAGPDLYAALIAVLKAQCYFASGMRVSEDSLLLEPLAVDPAFKQACLALRKAKGL